MLDTMSETSHAFLLPPGLHERLDRFDRRAIERELESIQETIDDETFTLYGIEVSDRATIEASFKRVTSNTRMAEQNVDEGDEVDDVDSNGSALGGTSAYDLSSWLVGALLAGSTLDLLPASGLFPSSQARLIRCRRIHQECGPKEKGRPGTQKFS